MGDSLHDGVGAAGRVAGLEDAGADEHAVCAQLHHQRGVGGGGDAASGEIDHRQAALLTSLLEQVEGDAEVAGFHYQLVVGHGLELADGVLHRPHVAHGFHHVAGSGFALGANHGRALGYAPQGLAQIAAAADEGHLEVVLPDVMRLVGGGQYFRLVNVVNAESFQNLGLDEMADTNLGHHRNRNRVHYPGDDGGIGHAGHAPVGADVRRNALEGHDRHGPGLGGNLSLLRGDHIHYDAALEHLGMTRLDGKSAG